MLRKIKRIIAWIPVLWNICDCCDHSLFVIMRHQIKRMADRHEELNVYVGSANNVKKMRLVIALLNRIINDDYHEIAMMLHDKKWGEPVMDVDDDGRVDIYWPKAITDEQKAEQSRDFKFAMKRMGYLEKQDLEYLFMLLRKHVRKWWI